MMMRNMEALALEKEELKDLLEDILTRLQEIKEELASEFEDLEDMIRER